MCKEAWYLAQIYAAGVVNDELVPCSFMSQMDILTLPGSGANINDVIISVNNRSLTITPSIIDIGYNQDI